jgi:hypothetical protein
MAYMGVKVSTTPRQIFFPVGNGVGMTARSFAKPFGGRIGPWYKSNWTQGAPRSDGTLVDALIPPRIDESNIGQDDQDPRRLPNYARYPGDTLGMSSKLALNALDGLGGIQIEFDSYKSIREYMSVGAMNDPLAWDGPNNAPPPVRAFEIAAIAPDLFDATYYSVEPNYPKNYYERILAAKDALQIPSDVPIRTDLGESLVAKEFSVQQQMAESKTKSIQRPEAFYFLRDKTNLLTAWLPAPGAFNYDTSAALANFGKCSVPDDGLKYPNPGSCVAGGGRTGASVKIISRDALLSNQHKIGGAAAAGAILNPPKGDGW